MATKEQKATFARIRQIIGDSGYVWFRARTCKNKNHHRMTFWNPDDMNVIYAYPTEINKKRAKILRKIKAKLAKEQIAVSFCGFKQCTSTYDEMHRMRLVITL